MPPRTPGMVGHVTETRALDEMISEALAVIDKGLGELGHRELVSSNEVADLLLDVRTLLAHPSSADLRAACSALALERRVLELVELREVAQ